MKYLTLALLVCSCVTLSNAQCFVNPTTPDLDKMTHCKDYADGTWHEVGSYWINSNCQKCSCSGCCLAYHTPTNFPADCVSVFNKEECRYVVHKKDNPSVACKVTGAVGK